MGINEAAAISKVTPIPQCSLGSRKESHLWEHICKGPRNGEVVKVTKSLKSDLATLKTKAETGEDTDRGPAGASDQERVRWHGCTGNLLVKHH